MFEKIQNLKSWRIRFGIEEPFRPKSDMITIGPTVERISFNCFLNNFLRDSNQIFASFYGISGSGKTQSIFQAFKNRRNIIYLDFRNGIFDDCLKRAIFYDSEWYCSQHGTSKILDSLTGAISKISGQIEIILDHVDCIFADNGKMPDEFKDWILKIAQMRTNLKILFCSNTYAVADKLQRSMTEKKEKRKKPTN